MKYFAPIFGLCLFLFPAIAFAAGSDVQVTLFGENDEALANFHPFGADYRGSVSIASADLGQDGVHEILVGSGPGLPPLVKLYRQDGSIISEFLAYAPTYQNGITVTACDVTGDGDKEIITGTLIGGGPHVRIFTSTGEPLFNGGFFAYAGDFRGGVNVACGDVNADKRDEIITGAGATGGPHVKVFTPYGVLVTEVFAGSAAENTGASVAVGDVNGDGDDEVITGRFGGGEPTVMVFDFKQNYLSFMVALHAFENYTNGIQVSSGDVDNDGRDEIGVTTNRHETGLIKYFELTGALAAEKTPFSSNEEKGVVATTVETNSVPLLLAASSSITSGSALGKSIVVDVSEQRLYAYENGVLANTFLVSTGTYSYPTPLGKTEVMAKLLWHDYSWYYGAGNPNNYSLPGVKYNLRFRNHYYIHSAYWHNNFGHRMSHGCVNAPDAGAEWVFNWAEVGTPVEVRE